MATSSDKPARKHFDIQRPGRSAPNANSRPTIVGHHTILQDPMVNKPVQDDEPQPEVVPLAAKLSVKLTPSDEAIASQKAADDETVAKKAETAEGGSSQDDKAENREVTTETPKIETQDSIDDNEGDKQNSDTGADEQKKIDQKAKEDQAKTDQINQLIVDKTFFVPIGEKKRKRSKHHVVAWLVVAIILGVATIDLMVDARIIKTSIKPPVSLFHNNQ